MTSIFGASRKDTIYVATSEKLAWDRCVRGRRPRETTHVRSHGEVRRMILFPLPLWPKAVYLPFAVDQRLSGGLLY